MDEDIDMIEVKQTLENAGLFEPNVPDTVLVNYYKAVKNSENTASKENESRRINENQEELLIVMDESLERCLENSNTSSKNKDEPFTPKVSETSEKKLSQNNIPEHDNNHNVKKDDIDVVIGDLFKDATKMIFGFNEMVMDSEHTLSIITHQLQFVSIHNSQSFLNAGTDLKAKMLYAYHTKVNKIKNQLARMSFNPAPLPDVTSTADAFPDFSNVDLQETYICRSGRQTKRKTYRDDEDEDNFDGILPKKSKNLDEEWLRKPTPKKILIRSNKKMERQVSIEAEEANAIITEEINENAKPASKLETRIPPNKENNLDILKCNGLFAESPKTRCDNLKIVEEEKLQEEKAKEMINVTLENDSINIDANQDIITIDDDDDGPIRRRVVPPVPARRAINNRKRSKLDSVAPLDISVTSPTIENVTKSPKKLVCLHQGTTNAVTDNLPSTSKSPEAESNHDDVMCPICDGLFHKDEILEHASSCGDEPVTLSSSKILRITCDKDLDTSHEVHLKDCLNNVKDL